MAKQEITCDDVLKELRAKQYRPIYYLMGEESYYIDVIANYMAEHILSDSEKEFNLTIVYGADTDIVSIINAAKRYPMMAEQKPQSSTKFVICHKHGVIDRRKKLATEIEKKGILFESKKVKESQLPAFISAYMKRKGINIEPKASVMLADFVGTDLSRLSGELDKLALILPKNQTCITPELIEHNIGISKDYNNFELRSALVEKDVLKANKIIKYFEENPKTNPIQMTLSLLFGFFSNLMLAYYAPEKTEQGIAAFLGLKSSWQSREYMNAMRRFSGIKTMEIIGEIRYADALSKGVGNSSLSNAEILKELIFKIGTIRREANLSARALSLKIDMHESYINRLETQKDFLPSLEVFFKILDACNCSAERFFYHDYNGFNSDMELLDKFKSLSEDKKQALLAFIK